jgi:hypothetical protein
MLALNCGGTSLNYNIPRYNISLGGSQYPVVCQIIRMAYPQLWWNKLREGENVNGYMYCSLNSKIPK